MNLSNLTPEMRRRILEVQPDGPLSAEQVAEINALLRPHGMALPTPAGRSDAA
jgi:hypothetical protein